MIEPDPRRRALRWLTLLCVLLIAHGSLWPYHVHRPVSFDAALAGLLHQPTWWTGLGDVVGNIALFVPLGALSMLQLPAAPRARAPAALLMLLASVAFAFALQVLQIYLPERSAGLSDAVWNGLGHLLGMALAPLLRRALPTSAPAAAAIPNLALVVLWVLLQMWPLMPTIDWQHIKDALRPLLRAPAWSTASALEAALGIALAGHALRDLRHRLPLLALAALAGSLGRLFVVGQVLTLPHLAGLLAGLAAVPLLWRARASTAGLLAVAAALAWFTADELRPFVLADEPHGFEWLPFVAALQGSMGANTFALGGTFFWIGVVMVQVHGQGGRTLPAAAGLGLWVLALEGVQTWLPGRIAEVTPALLPFVWALLLGSLGGTGGAMIDTRRRSRSGTHRRREPTP